MNIEIPIFKPGTHTAMSGDQRAYSDADLAATAAAYDPALFDAPAVIGHPEHNGPAWGWVESLAIKGGVLSAKLRDLDANFVEMVRAKRFKKISASFYLPDSPANPKPGVFYLRHVGFLGAAAPALKNLPAVNLSESDGALIYEEQMYYHPAANLMQSGQTGPIDHTEKPMTQENDELKNLTKKIAALEAEKAALETQSANYQEQAAAAQTALADRERAARHDSHEAFCDKLVDDGRLLPVARAVAVAALDLIAAQEKPLEFSEGGNTAQLTVDKFKAALSSFPKIVDFGERSADDGKTGKQRAIVNVPQGFDVDPKAAALHDKALAYIEQHPGTEYLTAVAAVERTA
ncbi:MAG: peptidase [Gammaproteobacteria bacterium]|nr:MAG: peptidase [Gammaproteobacteria bacterium]